MLRANPKSVLLPYLSLIVWLASQTTHAYAQQPGFFYTVGYGASRSDNKDIRISDCVKFSVGMEMNPVIAASLDFMMADEFERDTESRQKVEIKGYQAGGYLMMPNTYAIRPYLYGGFLKWDAESFGFNRRTGRQKDFSPVVAAGLRMGDRHVGAYAEVSEISDVSGSDLAQLLFGLYVRFY